ncbi:hypothetical protein CPB84DRAFT_1798723, partial [Gymnopilus junonius]
MGRYSSKRTMLLLLIVMLNSSIRPKLVFFTLYLVCNISFISVPHYLEYEPALLPIFCTCSWIIRESTKLNCTSIYENMRWQQRTLNKKIS